MSTKPRVKIYHYQSCSKSCAALAFLNHEGVDIEVINYLENTPNKEQLQHILKLLGLKPQELIRKNESLFKEKFESLVLSDNEWLEVLLENPILMERPIIIKGDQAVIARPIEKLTQLLNSSS